MGWFIFGLVVGAGITMVVMSILTVGSKVDDILLGEDQYK